MDVNDMVEITSEEGKIIIRKRDVKKHVTLAERLKDYAGDYVFEECDWGSPVGNEAAE